MTKTVALPKDKRLPSASTECTADWHLWLLPSNASPSEARWHIVRTRWDELFCSEAPNDSANLYRKFASTKTDRDSVLEFVKEHGFLRSQKHWARLISPVGQLLPDARGELVDAWTDEIHLMKDAIGLWTAMNTEESDKVIDCSKKLIKRLKLDDSGVVVDDLQQAKELLYGLINQKLSTLTSPKLVWNAEGGRPSLRIVSDSLLGNIWYQFALAVSSAKGYRTCAECGAPFEVERRQGVRADKEYCSDACRMRAYRRRKSNPFQD